MLLLALLGACATTAPGDQQASVSRVYHEAVNMTGRLSIRYQENGKEQALHGSFNWSQQPDRILVSLLSPLGQTLAIIESTPSGAVLRQPGQAPRHASDVDALTLQTLGWPLPVAGLRYWLQGFAREGTDPRAIASPAPNAMPETSTQDGWRLYYASWNRDATSSHPKRLDLQRYTAQAGEVEIRLIVDSFQAL